MGFQVLARRWSVRRGCGRLAGVPTVAILAALDEELEAFRGAHRLVPVEEGTPFPAYRFRTGGVEAVLMRTGVGKAFAAMVA